MKTTNDTLPEPREHTLNGEPRIPIQTWSLDKTNAIWALGGLQPDNTWVYNFVGVRDRLDTIEAVTPRTSIHLYDGTYLDKFSITAGEHCISKGAYAAFVNASGQAILYVDGHINNLIVEGTAQVFLNAGAYVDYLSCSKGGFIRIEKGASIHGGQILKDGKAEISTMAEVNDLDITESAIVCHMPDKDVYPLSLSIYVKGIEARNKICKQITDEYRAEGKVRLGKLVLYDVCNCFVLPAIGTETWSVHLSSNTEPKLSREDIEATVNNHFDLEDAVTAWVDGLSLKDIEAKERAERAESESNKWQELHTLRARVKELEEDLGIRATSSGLFHDDDRIGPPSFRD